MPEKDIKFKKPRDVDLSTLLRSSEELLKAHQLAVEKTLQFLEGVRHDDPEEYQG